MHIPTLLTIAGTDPSSGAGIQVDLQMFARHGFHGTSVITAILWQDTRRVHGWHIPPVEVFTSQLHVILDDIPPAAIKLGVLPTAATVTSLADTLDARASSNAPLLVVHDPVLASGDGSYSLVESGTLESMRERLFPHVTCLTPNLPEAAALLDTPLQTLSQRPLPDIAAEIAHHTGVPMILLKAGHTHTTHDTIQDAIAAPDMPPALLSPLPRQPLHTHGVRGTGCQLASALTALLASGIPFPQAAEEARADLASLLATRAFSPGKGRPVIGHFSRPK